MFHAQGSTVTNLPDFIDNQSTNTLARALGEILGSPASGHIAHPATSPGTVRIATAFFNPAGFSQIADQLTTVPTVRLLLGADLAMGNPNQRKKLDETPEQFEQRRLRKGLDRMDTAMRDERDRLPFNRTSAVALQKLIEVLRSGNMEVRRYEKVFLHAKAYIVTPKDEESVDGLEGIIVGSSNLTGAGLAKNLELNLGRYDKPIVERAQQWFDALWEEAEPYDLSTVFEEALQLRSPWEVFIRVLWQLYGNEVEEDAKIDRSLPLTSFQKHGVARALRLIQEMGGVIIADEVGLGKTFIAGEILRRYGERRQRGLLLCPAALRDSTWKNFIHAHQLFVECLSFEQLAYDVQLRDSQRPRANQNHLQRALDEYQLVIVDEAHNYRNPDAPFRAATLRKLMYGRKRDLMLLTATPVNNSLWDLYHLLRFFLRQDAHLAKRGVLSVRERFDRAMKEDPSSLSPDVLYPVIDATTVKRTRQFVKKHYERDTITGPDGNPQPIVFPTPRAISVRYNLDDLLPGFFDHLEHALDPDDDDGIKFVRYTPDIYRLNWEDGEESARAGATVGLLRSGLLKRFESSAFAFRRTIEKMIREHSTFLDALDAGYVVTTAFMKELSADDDAIFEDVLSETENREDAGLYDVEALRASVERDRGLLESLANEAAQITPHRDPKLRALADALCEISKQAEADASGAEDEKQKRKVLVFSFFEDTVEWIRDFLTEEIQKRPELLPYKDRMELVSGSGEHGQEPRQKAVLGFAPISMGALDGQGSYDLLISTDVLAEGVNLQQCRHIINFDMPWNPMRLVQRHGRIDRIGSPHNRVFLRTIFPADRLDSLLNLEQRILNKLAMAAASIGVAAPIEGAAYGTQVFTETREEIEKLLNEDPSLFERGGTAGAAQTGEEYRQTLRKVIELGNERISNLPWKIGAWMRKGQRRGIFFCAVVGRQSNFERTYLRFVAANDKWNPEMNKETGQAGIEREIGTCLRLLECAEDEPDQPSGSPQDRVYDFWDVARDDILQDWMRETDPANLQPAIRPLNHRVEAFIRENTPHGIPEEHVEKALDILASPWPRREEIMLRGWFEASKHEGIALSGFLIDKIIDTGLEPVLPPDPLPPIEPEDIELLCWMGIEAQSNNSASSS